MFLNCRLCISKTRSPIWRIAKTHAVAMILLMLCYSTNGYAQSFGFAMHGQAKYNENSVHLDYANPDAPKSGHLKQSVIGTFDTLNPFSIKGKSAQGLNLVYDRLMTRVWDEPFTMYPNVAERYETDEQRSFITFHINPHAKFNDGSSIKPSDILFSFNTLREHGRPNMRKVYKLVKNAEILCSDTIIFEFGEGYDRETAMIIAMMPVLSKAWWEGRDFNSTILEAPNANGPYIIENFDPGRSISYRRNPNYWALNQFPHNGQYNFKNITYEYFRDDSVALESFLGNDLNLRRELDIAKWFNSYESPRLATGDIKKSEFNHQRPERAHGFIFNTRRTLFNDPKTRQALSIALDRQWIIDSFYNGAYSPISSYFPNSEFQYATEKKPTNKGPSSRERLRMATTLLKESGWKIENGILVKDGHKFEFELLLNNPEEEKIALQLQKNLKRLGIQMNVRVIDQAAFLGRLGIYDFDMISMFWRNSLSPGTEQVIYWGCEAGEVESGFNYAGICDPEIDALAQSVAQTTNRSELVETMRKLDQKLMEGYYMIPLFYKGKDYVAHDKSLKHTEFTPIYGPVIESWWMSNNHSSN